MSREHINEATKNDDLESPLMKLVLAQSAAIGMSVYFLSNGDYDKASKKRIETEAKMREIRAAVQELERDAARYAHIISRITQSEMETVIRREHDDDGEYTAGLVQMIDAAMEADK